MRKRRGVEDARPRQCRPTARICLLALRSRSMTTSQEPPGAARSRTDTPGPPASDLLSGRHSQSSLEPALRRRRGMHGTVAPVSPSCRTGDHFPEPAPRGVVDALGEASVLDHARHIASFRQQQTLAAGAECDAVVPLRICQRVVAPSQSAPCRASGDSLGSLQP